MDAHTHAQRAITVYQFLRFRFSRMLSVACVDVAFRVRSYPFKSFSWKCHVFRVWLLAAVVPVEGVAPMGSTRGRVGG